MLCFLTRPYTNRTRPRPKDPAIFEIEGTKLDFRFSDYGETLPIGGSILVLIQALTQAFDRVLAARGDAPLESDLEFAVRDVHLIAFQGANMTYKVLKSAISCIVGFMLDYGSFAFTLDILDPRNRKISTLSLFHK